MTLIALALSACGGSARTEAAVNNGASGSGGDGASAGTTTISPGSPEGGASPGAPVGNAGGAAGSACTEGGVEHAVGASWACSDGCNTCTCAADSFGAVYVSSTAEACLPCVYAGIAYPAGSQFPDRDGCNQCTCSGIASVKCSTNACACDPANEWWRTYAGTSPHACEVTDLACSPGMTPFSNDCGCGCEEAVSCPQTCVPGQPCPPAGCPLVGTPS